MLEVRQLKTSGYVDVGLGLQKFFSNNFFVEDNFDFEEVEVRLVQSNMKVIFHIDGLVQDCSDSSVLAMELLQSCTKPSICNPCCNRAENGEINVRGPS